MLHYIKHKAELLVYSLKENRTYMKFSEGGVNKEARQDYVLAVAAHTIEKGLGCVEYRPGWGIDKAKRLCRLMEKYLDSGYSQKQFGFYDAYAVCRAFIEHKKMSGEDILEIEEAFSRITKRLGNVSFHPCKAGKVLVNRSELGVDCEYIQHLFDSCRSIRNYEEMEVQEEDIIKAVRMSAKAPSACNRQPVKCYFSMDKEKIKLVDKILPGNAPIKGKTPNFIIVTASLSHFGLYEYGQWNINGGIFLAYLRIALHSCGIGNCIYQWTINAPEGSIRERYQIPENEKIIAVIGIGYFPKQAHCIEAQRKDVEELLIKR